MDNLEYFVVRLYLSDASCVLFTLGSTSFHAPFQEYFRILLCIHRGYFLEKQSIKLHSLASLQVKLFLTQQ